MHTYLQRIAPLLRPLDTDFLGTSDISAFEQKLIAEHTHPPTPCAVVALCFSKADALYLTFILRPTYEGTHSGQIAFAGGKKDTTDATLLATALRECEEELGLRLPSSAFLGALPDVYIPPSHSLVTPFVAYLPTTPVYVPNTREVAQLLELKFTDFCLPTSQQIQAIQISTGKVLQLPCFRVEGHTIWGATARMMKSLIDLGDVQ